MASFFGIEKKDLIEDKNAVIESFEQLTSNEINVLNAYRAGDDLTKSMVHRILGIE